MAPPGSTTRRGRHCDCNLVVSQDKPVERHSVWPLLASLLSHVCQPGSRAFSEDGLARGGDHLDLHFKSPSIGRHPEAVLLE